MNPVIKGSYLGRRDQARDLLTLIRQNRSRLETASAHETKKKRSELAKKFRILKHRAQQRCLLTAKDTAEAKFATELLKLNTSYRRALYDSRKECLELCLRISSEVLGSLTPGLPEQLAHRVNSALSQLHVKSGIVIEVHPEDLEGLKAQLSLKKATSKIEICADEELQRGCACIATPVGRVVVDWSKHLEQLKTDLRDSLRQRTDKERA